MLSSTYLLEKYNDSDPNEKVEKHLKRIRYAVEGMKSILEDFLSLGKLEEGLVQTKMEAVSADELIKDMNNLVLELDTLLKPAMKVLIN